MVVVADSLEAQASSEIADVVAVQECSATTAAVAVVKRLDVVTRAATHVVAAVAAFFLE